MKAFVPSQQPFQQSGAQHPAGCMLAFSMTTQPSGRVRLDCYKDDLMVMCAYNLSPRDADQYAKDFMKDGDQLNPVIRRYRK